MIKTEHEKEFGIYHLDLDSMKSCFLDHEADTIKELIKLMMNQEEYKGKEGYICIVDGTGTIRVSQQCSNFPR